ncbi:hypothetical protein [Shimia sp.]|uniref:hypothetical protein n=1 Tax=Shimia sp. TaxID=1954381 RepID=UPI003299EC9C
MRIALSVLLISTLTLSACQSRWNPSTWFDGNNQVPKGDVNPLLPPESQGLFSPGPDPVYPGTPVLQIQSLKVERVPEGALITAVGLPLTHGVFDIRLRPRNEGKVENGVLTLDLLAIQPPGSPRGGNEQSREVTAGYVATNQDLQGVRTIRVAGAQNAREARR